MKINIKNLGFVKDVSIDLDKELTIFCGPNNTGKTYIAYVIYGLLERRFYMSVRSSILDKKGYQQLKENGEIKINISEMLPKLKLEEHIASYLKTELPSILGMSSRDYISETSVSVKIDFKKLESKFRTKEINTKSFEEEVAFISKAKESLDIIVKLYSSPLPEDGYDYIISPLNSIIRKYIKDFLFHNVYIATAERSSISLFSKELSLKRNELVDSLLDLSTKRNKEFNDPFDLVQRRATRYALPIRDSLELSEDLNNFKKQSSKFAYLAEELEKDMLKGKVSISEDGQVEYSPEKATNLKLPINLTASIVKSLSSLVIYFRHLATKNDFIIIDEPELNLHPDNQVVIARFIAKLVNQGFKVLISTHSDYIIKELNNLILAGSKPKLAKNIKEYTDDKFLKVAGYTKDIFLKPNQVQPILFHYDVQKCINLEVKNDGFEVETIENAINSINQATQYLYFNDEEEAD